ncbi:hypothetical protein MHYP_G00147140 [Metynnis hypsauchen]
MDRSVCDLSAPLKPVLRGSVSAVRLEQTGSKERSALIESAPLPQDRTSSKIRANSLSAAVALQPGHSRTQEGLQDFQEDSPGEAPSLRKSSQALGAAGCGTAPGTAALSKHTRTTQKPRVRPPSPNSTRCQGLSGAAQTTRQQTP